MNDVLRVKRNRRCISRRQEVAIYNGSSTHRRLKLQYNPFHTPLCFHSKYRLVERRHIINIRVCPSSYLKHTRPLSMTKSSKEPAAKKSHNGSFATDDVLPREVSSALTSPPPISDLLSDDIMAPYRHVCSLESKRFRATLVDAFNVWLELPECACDEVKAIVDMLHNASLIVDDIEDSSNLRRGAPAAHRVFGMPLSLNCANTVYFLALERLRQVPQVVVASIAATGDHAAAEYYAVNKADITIRLIEAFSTEMIELHKGQGLDIYWRDMAQCPSLTEYKEMVQRKTGGLFRLAVKMMMILSPPSQVCANAAKTMSTTGSWRSLSRDDRNALLLSLVDDVGTFFQTLDDYLNVCSDAYHKNKSFCEDLTEGKFSYPVIHCILEQAAKGEKTLLHILRQRPTDAEIKAYCVNLMRDTGSLQACQGRIYELRSDIYRQLASLGDGALLEECIAGLCRLME